MYTALLAVLVPVSSPQQCKIYTICHDRVEAFAHPEPVTESEKAAVKFNPTILFICRCDLYPAVDKELGKISGGLYPSGKPYGSCKNLSMALKSMGVRFGSGVYSPSCTHNSHRKGRWTKERVIVTAGTMLSSGSPLLMRRQLCR